MVAYLSDEWIAALDAALASAPALPPSPSAAPAPLAPSAMAGDVTAVNVQYRVTGGPGGDRCWYLCLAPDRLAARAGEAGQPLVTFTQVWSVATAIAAGRRSAADAILAGDVRVSGNSAALVPWRASLRRVDAALARLAACTDLPSADPRSPEPPSPGLPPADLPSTDLRSDAPPASSAPTPARPR